jgi:DNA primase
MKTASPKVEQAISRVQEIYDAISMKQYLKARGLKLRRILNGNHTCHCPLHEDNNQSMVIHDMPRGGEMFRCYSCQRSGSVIALIAAVEKKSKKEVAQELYANIKK